MKNKIVSLSLFGLLAIVTVISCKKNVTKEPSAVNTDFKKPLNVSTVINAQAKSKFVGKFGKLKRLKNQQIQTNTGELFFLTFNDPTIVSYEGTDVQAVIFDQGNGTSFVGFQQNGLVGDMGAFISIVHVSSTVSTGYIYDVDYQLVAQFDVENGDMQNISTYNPTPLNSTNGWFSRWTTCLTNSFNNTVNKAPLLAVACAYFAGPCMAGLLTGCAAAATFN
jgi:hypothetical protein